MDIDKIQEEYLQYLVFEKMYNEEMKKNKISNGTFSVYDDFDNDDHDWLPY